MQPCSFAQRGSTQEHTTEHKTRTNTAHATIPWLQTKLKLCNCVLILCYSQSAPRLTQEMNTFAHGRTLSPTATETTPTLPQAKTIPMRTHPWQRNHNNTFWHPPNHMHHPTTFLQRGLHRKRLQHSCPKKKKVRDKRGQVISKSGTSSYKA